VPLNENSKILEEVLTVRGLDVRLVPVIENTCTADVLLVVTYPMNSEEGVAVTRGPPTVMDT
jgi:hypothetical protein